MSKPKSGWYPKNYPIAKELIKKVKETYGENNITEDDVVGIMKTEEGKIIWLEKGKAGDRGAGLAHIVEKHQRDFENIGIDKDNISKFALNAVAYGTIIGQQGNRGTRPIYQYNYGGKVYYISATIGDDGYIVSANPLTEESVRRYI